VDTADEGGAKGEDGGEDDEQRAQEPEATEESAADRESEESESAASGGTQEVPVPDIGDFDEVEVIEVLVSDGDQVKAEDSLITLESDKASMEIPAPFGGTVKDVKVKVGDKVSEGSVICSIEAEAGAQKDKGDSGQKKEKTEEKPAKGKQQESRLDEEDHPPPPDSGPRPSPTAHIDHEQHRKAHASPGVRRFARELGVDLSRVEGSGRKGRIVRDDVKAFVKRTLSQPAAAGGGMGLPAMPEIDFSEFGEIETKPLTKINKLTGRNLHRNWVTVPHVTQFDEADITDLERFRKELNEEYKDKGIKLTLVAFLLKAVASGLKQFPRFNSSLDPSGENLIYKKYFHIGVAVDTKDGLVVPVIRDVERKSLIDVGAELIEISKAARDKKLTSKQMKGGCFSISSLGGVGGTAFTPIVNAPEVAILGVSKASTKPVWNGKEFEPRLILPLSLSYDHRVIDGADAARFTTHIGRVLSDTRRLLL
ncbi:MAG: dihydrolipoyllysine-residue acetyltransferase, partial [Halofilum sp. (in: g-proteobacteria)]|nr:dihydrolipoyllysine-residue acetyltransferase [Halofilum sp. (in: g-proteobacteria)]